MTKVTLIQYPGNCRKKENFDHLQKDLELAANSGSNIILLPELFLHEYFPQSENSEKFKLAHDLSDPHYVQLKSFCKKYNTVLIFPFFEKRESEAYYNSCAVIDADGKNLGVYRKSHIPEDPGFYEKFYFTPGDSGYSCFNTKHGKIGILICWDQWFPEAARLTAIKGCELLVFPTAIAWDKNELSVLNEHEEKKLKQKQLNAWITIQRSHAIANGVFLASVNRVGVEKDLEFWGNSFICDPFGEILIQGDLKKSIITSEINFSVIEETRKIWPFWRDRRIDTYEGICKK